MKKRSLVLDEPIAAFRARVPRPGFRLEGADYWLLFPLFTGPIRGWDAYHRDPAGFWPLYYLLPVAVILIALVRRRLFWHYGRPQVFVNSLGMGTWFRFGFPMASEIWPWHKIAEIRPDPQPNHVDVVLLDDKGKELTRFAVEEPEAFDQIIAAATRLKPAPLVQDHA